MAAILEYFDEKIAACELRATEVADDLKFVYIDAAKEAREIRAAVAELIAAAQEYRKQYGWQGNPWQERAAIKLDAALANVGSAS